MEDFGAMLSAGVQMLSVPFQLWGFTFDFWHLGLYICAGCIIIDLIRKGLD